MLKYRIRHADKEAKRLDAVTITIPDHMQPVALWAMERPLFTARAVTQSVWEAPPVDQGRRENKVPTQMGN